MNFTWFASSYDTDDNAYRLLTMVQMAGVLVLAAGVPAAADHADYRTVTLGYLIMRIGLGYAVAIPTAVFFALVWLVNASILAEPVIEPTSVLVGIGATLVLPLATPQIGLATVVAAIAAANVLVIAVTITKRSGREPVPHRTAPHRTNLERKADGVGS